MFILRYSDYCGSALFTGSKDKSLQVLDFETGKVKLRKPKAHR